MVEISGRTHCHQMIKGNITSTGTNHQQVPPDTMH